MAYRTSRLLVLSSLPVLVLSLAAAGCASDPDESGEEGKEPATEAVPPPPEPVTDFEPPPPASPAPPPSKYGHLDPTNLVPAAMLAEALAYFEANKAKIKNQKYITVVDFKSHSGKKRFFLIDMKTGAVEPHVVAHGSGSDANNDGVAEKFSNEPGSNASSVGYYLGSEVYSGKWGRSMRLDGLSPTNSQARPRAIVVHGADYVENGRTQQGRSWGCLVLPLDEKDAVIDKVTGGSLIYATETLK